MAILAFVHHQHEQERRVLACGAASTYVSHVLSQKSAHPYFFVTESPYRVPSISVDRFLASDEGRKWQKPEFALEVELAHERERLGSQSPFTECPKIKEILLEMKVSYGVLSNERLPPVQADGYYPHIYFSVSMPSIDRTKRFAALESSEVSGPLAGGGWEVRLEAQNNNTWAIEEESSTWIS